MEDKKLLKEAIQAATFAYIPYSQFAVGAALLLEDGKIIRSYCREFFQNRKKFY